MKITIVTDVLGLPNNGTSLAALNLINYLKQKGHDVKVVCPDEDKRNINGFFVMPKYDFGILNNYVAKNGVVIAKADKNIIHEACNDADIVHSILPFSVGRATLKYCLKNNIPFTSGFHAQAENITSHLFALNSKIATAIAYKNLWSNYYKYVNAIHFPTQFICDLVKRYGISGPKTYVISNGVDTNKFLKLDVSKPEKFNDKFVITMSGRYSKEKNQLMLLKAIKRSKYEKNIQIILAGDGPTKAKLEKYALKHLSNKPVFKRFDRCELAKVLNYSDLYVHTSIVEIEAISCLEALACGLVPVISNSKRSATSKFALDENSLFDFRSIEDLKNKIEWWYEHPKEKEEASIKYMNFAKRFDINECMEKMEQMLIETVEEYKNAKK